MTPRSLSTPNTTNWPCLRLDGKAPNHHVVIDVSVSPNAKKTEVTGWHDGALRVRLAAPPVDGAANDALRRWLAKELALPQARVTLIRGASSRRKQLTLETSMNQVDDWLKTFEVLR